MKTEQLKVLSLMDRMDKRMTLTESAEHEFEILDEATIQGRRQVTRDEIFDILEHGGLRNGQYFAMTYVSGEKPYKKKSKWRKDDVTTALGNNIDSANKGWFQKLSDFNDDNTTLKSNPIANIVAVTRYVIQMQGREGYKKAFGTYAEKLHNLRMKYGLGMQSNGMFGDNHNQTKKIDGGGEMSEKDNLQIKFNMAKSRRKSKAYLIDVNGDIEDIIPDDILRSMSAIKNHVERTAIDGLTPEQLQAYAAEKKEIDKEFRTQTFNYDGMLSIVATTAQGEKVYYINDKVISTLVNVNPEAFKELAMNELGASFEDIQGFVN